MNKYPHLREFGYAPGSYMIRSCMHCGECVDNVDKRAVSCFPCADALYNLNVKYLENFNLLHEVEKICALVGHTKADQPDIMLSLIEEAGETATEIKIERGLKKGPSGPDGVLGEAVDTVLCALDIIYTQHGGLNTDHVKKVFATKLNKWNSKYAPKNA